ncbi:hypothetical protein [Actinomadura xylanilytica]|uniref:hypothetical protein n=1 Tax=Actinomadura xylanilytica TaxID=887459 RepID=UPI00255AF5B0|nr:hypothetical protein [Actinomadura xylanilytica]MDL4770951.1 hypothetical protein [Actinomadura xylanilytica]
MIEARDTGSSQADRQDGGQDFWPEDKPGRESGGKRPGGKLLIYGAAAVAVVIAAVVAGMVLMTGGDDDEAPAGKTGNGKQALPTAYTPDYDGDGMSKIARRAADQRPVTEGEAFTADAKTVKSGKFTFGLAGSQVSGDCKAVTWGQRLQADLARHGCTQIVRGAYVSPDKKYAGQFFLINMENEDGVHQVLRDLDRDSGAGFVLPLTAPGAPAFGSGFSAAYAKTFGHYAVVTWVQRAGGAQPASLNEMIDASLAIEKPADFVWGRFS